MSRPLNPFSTRAVPLTKKVPPRANQHATAGPYSPVLRVEGRCLVVIAGQAAILPDGTVQGTGIETQTTLTLENCGKQLKCAGADLRDVFKVNVFMRDLADWPRFNVAYAAVMPPPYPVRTAVQAVLLPGLEVEIEMWAMLP